MAGEGGKSRTAQCPICGKPALEGHIPFCSKRCADVDLNRWLGGVYSIPTDERPDAAPQEDKGED
jgi:endogenous inhibitor of DNA gyrase (YacG/DUF329 family)